MERFFNNYKLNFVVNTELIAKNILQFLMYFYVGNAFVLGVANPFLIPFLSLQILSKKNYLFYTCGVLLGLSYHFLINVSKAPYFFNNPIAPFIIKYISIVCTLYIYNNLINKTNVKNAKHRIFVTTAILSFCTSAITLLFIETSAYILILFSIEFIFTLFLPSLIEDGLQLILLEKTKNIKNIQERDVISMTIIGIITLLATKSMYIFTFSIQLVLVLFYLLIISYFIKGSKSFLSSFLLLFIVFSLSNYLSMPTIVLLSLVTSISSFWTIRNKYIFSLFYLLFFHIIYLSNIVYFDLDYILLLKNLLVAISIFIVMDFKSLSRISKKYGVSYIEHNDMKYYNKAHLANINCTYTKLLNQHKFLIHTLNKKIDCNIPLKDKEKIKAYTKLLQFSNNTNVEAIEDILCSLKNNIKDIATEQTELQQELYKNNLHILSINIEKKDNTYIKIEITVPKTMGHNSVIQKIKYILEKKTNKKIQYLVTDASRENLVLHYCQTPTYRIDSYIQQKGKNNTIPSGDTYINIQKSSMHYIGLSDGMGHGKKAKSLSESTLNTIENLLDIQFPLDKTIKFVNNLQIINTNSDEFSTIDICEINSFTGKSRFFKQSSAPTYIIRKGVVEKIFFDSLPIGILNDIEVNSKSYCLHDKDIIVQISDGIFEANVTEFNKDAWLLDLLQTNSYLSASTLCKGIMDKALSYSDVPLDDMLVIVTEVKKNKSM